MLWTVAVVLFILWLLGFALDFGGGLIHLILVVAAIVIIVQFLQGRRSV
ncbi:lmo0937 family membrane protein [Sphingomonas sp. LT1P40]